MTAAGRALYLYGITSKASKRPLHSPGVDGESKVETIPCDGFICWISRVDAKEFAQELSRNMEDLEWLAAAGVAHQHVVAEIAHQADVLPARFGTVFLSERSLTDDIKKNKKGLGEALQIVSGADEWGVKVFAVAPPPGATVTAKSGKEYLQKKAEARRPNIGIKDPEIEHFALLLAKIAQGMAPGGKVSGAQRDLLWQVSLLLRRVNKRRMQQLLDRFAKRWRGRKRIECTGPWPPYSFVMTRMPHGR